jgi:hypothetical protein
MGVVTNVIEALHRIGSPTQKAALRRQDAQLVGKKVLGRRRVIIDGEFGRAHEFLATTAPIAGRREWPIFSSPTSTQTPKTTSKTLRGQFAARNEDRSRHP